MKSCIIIFAISLCSIGYLFAQAEDSFSLKDLETPSSPGFILLDKAS